MCTLLKYSACLENGMPGKEHVRSFAVKMLHGHDIIGKVCIKLSLQD